MTVGRNTASAVGATVTVLFCCWYLGLRLNLSDSIAPGLYISRAFSSIERAPLARGELVLVCLEGSAAELAWRRGYVPRGGDCTHGLMPVGKRIIAVPGDTLSVTAAGLAVNGALLPNSAPRVVDRHGRPLPSLAPVRVLVAPNEVWLGSTSPWGFDSRYFGAVRRSQVRALLTTLWVSRNHVVDR